MQVHLLVRKFMQAAWVVQLAKQQYKTPTRTANTRVVNWFTRRVKLSAWSITKLHTTHWVQRQRQLQARQTASTVQQPN